MLVLDTDHMTLLEHPGSVDSMRIRHRLDQQVREPVVTTIVTYEEQTRGWLAHIAKAKTIDHQVICYCKLSRHLDVYRMFCVLDFTTEAAAVFRQLVRARLGVGTMDLKIAAIALTNDATLLTRNVNDFGRVPGLRFEDWTQ